MKGRMEIPSFLFVLAARTFLYISFIAENIRLERKRVDKHFT